MRLSRRTILAAAGTLAVAGRARAQAPAKVGIVGAGRIGGTLAGLWAKAGLEVFVSSRHPEELKDLVAALGPKARAGMPAEAVAFGDAVLLAVPYRAYPQLGRDLSGLAGKVVLDAGNATQARDGDLAGEAQRDGIGVTSARYLPGARIVRAFNTLGSSILAREAHRQGGSVAIPIASDDKGALDVASALVRAAGFDPVVVGGLASASRFQMGAEGYGQLVTAPELRTKLGL